MAGPGGLCGGGGSQLRPLSPQMLLLEHGPLWGRLVAMAREAAESGGSGGFVAAALSALLQVWGWMDVGIDRRRRICVNH